MKKDKRIIRQEKMAKILYELGMDVDVISRVSGVDKQIVENFNKNKNIKNVCNE